MTTNKPTTIQQYMSAADAAAAPVDQAESAIEKARADATAAVEACKADPTEENTVKAIEAAKTLMALPAVEAAFHSIAPAVRKTEKRNHSVRSNLTPITGLLQAQHDAKAKLVPAKKATVASKACAISNRLMVEDNLTFEQRVTLELEEAKLRAQLGDLTDGISQAQSAIDRLQLVPTYQQVLDAEAAIARVILDT